MCRMLSILLALSSCCSALAQHVDRKCITYGGVDLGRSLVDGSLGVRLGHGFAGHWSVGGEFVFPLNSGRLNDDEYVHYEEVDGQIAGRGKGRLSFDAGVSYWVTSPYEGLHLGASLSGGLPEKIPIVRAEAGYMVVFMKVMRAGAAVSWNMSDMEAPLQAKMTIGCVF